MTTLKDIEKRSDEIIKMKNIVEQYRNQVEQLKSEIVELEKEVSETLDFEKDVELQEKKERLPKFEKRLREAEQKSKKELRDKGLAFMTTTARYQKKQMKEDKKINQAYQTAVNKLKTAYEAIEAYEEERENKAERLADEVAQAGYTEATNGLGLASTHDRAFQILDSVKNDLNLTAHNQKPKDFFDEVLKQ